MKNLVIILSLVILFTNCKKTEVSYTLKGQILPCTGYNITDPYQLYQKNNGSNSNAKVIATTKTDVNGNFSFTYNTNNIKDKLILRQSSGFGFSEILEEIDVKDIPDLIIGKPFYHLIISLNVTKPYSQNDTLFFQSYNNSVGLKLAGPFVSGRIISASNLHVANLNSLTQTPAYSGNLHRVFCALNTPFGYTGVFDKEYTVPLPSKCSSDSIYVTLDIK